MFIWECSVAGCCILNRLQLLDGCLVLTFLPVCTFYHTGCQCLLMVTFNYDDTYWLLLCELLLPGDVAQMVERSLSMWEVGGSIPPVSSTLLLLGILHLLFLLWLQMRNQKVLASSGNRTRAARVAGEHSTTEPTMLVDFVAMQQCSSCGRVVKATDSKSVSLWERRFESYRLRETFFFCHLRSSFLSYSCFVHSYIWASLVQW